MPEHWFSGIEVQPVSTVTKFPKVYIDSAFVRVYEDIYGEIYYEVVGCGAKGAGWPLSQPTQDVRLALGVCRGIEARIEAARAEERKRRSAYTLQLIGEIKNGQEKSPDR
ncbi:MAG: hypothetical protein PUJ93_06590 [Oscillospiraceae bacterium]|nr:hypothetical protein [Oscillospiraceae bacterium]MDY5735613.1 hypothetical protein [Oscillospiraceae bacterium]